MVTHYDTLCISPTATEEEIRQAYKSLLLAVHPDKRVSDGNASVIRVSMIQEAYAVLKNRDSRAQYDLELRWKQVYEDQAEVFDRIHVSDMEGIGGDGSILRYPCRCGDVFEVEGSLLADKENHEYIVGCSSCSLLLAIITCMTHDRGV